MSVKPYLTIRHNQDSPEVVESHYSLVVVEAGSYRNVVELKADGQLFVNGEPASLREAEKVMRELNARDNWDAGVLEDGLAQLRAHVVEH